MQIGNQFRLYPDRAQAKTLQHWIGCQRYLYNAKVREDIYFRRFARKSLQHAGQRTPIDQQYCRFKTELTPFLSEAPSVVLRNGAALWKQAYGRFFSKLGGRPTIHRNMRKQSVNGADALQLAAAVVGSRHIPWGFEFFCLDSRLSMAAQREGVNVIGG
ncbi:MAG: helix-turn-helix domain-containing protein [Sulfuricaulis sp.]